MNNDDVNNNIVEQPKRSNKGLIIFLVILLVLLLGVGGFFAYKYFTNEDNSNEKPNNTSKKEEESVYPPDGVQINELKNGTFSIGCMKEGTLDYVNKVPVKKGDIVTCEYGLEDPYKIETVYYQFDYGTGLKLIEIKKRDNQASSKVEGNRVSDVYTRPQPVLDSPYYFRFEVLDDTYVNNLVFRISNIVIKSISNDYYKLNDESVTFKNSSKLFYIYEVSTEDDKYIDITNNKRNDSNSKLLNEYRCSSEECYDVESRGDYILFDDGSHIAFNYITGEKIVLDKFKKYSIRLVSDSKLRGLILFDETLGGEAYYSFESEKYIVDFKKGQYLNAFDGYLYLSKDDDSSDKLIDYKGNDFVPTIKELHKIEETEFYYIDAGTAGSIYFFFNKDGKALFNRKSYSSLLQGTYQVTKDGNLILREGNKFVEYNINEEVIYESAEYNDFDFIVDINDKGVISSRYIVAVDKDNKLKLIDSRENLIHEFVTLNKDNEVHWALSGFYEYQKKHGIYMVVQDNSITDKELLDGLKAQGEEISDYTLEEDRGYEYYYIPTTKESGKFVTVIGGYAKPILYLYPEVETQITVNFSNEDNLTTTYPKFKNEWKVLAKPNGDLYDSNGKYYYGLYWEEDLNHKVDFSEGFYVTKENAIEFLEEKLTYIGLNDKERNEFIMYWLPILEKNGKNLVYFELTDERDSFNKLIINPKPDSILRLAIHVKKVNNKVNIKEQKLETFNRTGFTAVEWGGMTY